MTTEIKDPFKLGNYFQLEPSTENDFYWKKTKLIATPILAPSQEMGISNDPLVSYITISSDPETHVLKIALYLKRVNAEKLQIGELQDTKHPTLQKKVIANHADIAGLFRAQFISYFQKENDRQIISRAFTAYDCLKIEEVPFFCPLGLSFIICKNKVAKFISKHII